MRKLCSMLAVLALVLCITAVQADEKKADDKEVTLKGTLQCAKCHLKKASKCETVIVVKEKDKEVVYWLDEASHKKNHSQICTKKKEGEVKGKVSKDGDKLIITATEVTFK
jgi:hypothetical protein